MLRTGDADGQGEVRRAVYRRQSPGYADFGFAVPSGVFMSRPLACAVALIAAAAAPADDAYTLKLYKLKEGDVIKRTSSVKSDGKATTVVGEKSEDQPLKREVHVVLIDEALKWPADAKQPTLRKRTFEKSEVTDAAGKTTTSEYAGKSFVTEVVDGKPTHTVDGRPATAEQAAVIADRPPFGSLLTFTDAWLPDKPVKVGDAWTPGVKGVLASAGIDVSTVDLEQSSATCKLVKVVNRGKSMWGTVEFDVRLSLTRLLGGTLPRPTDAGSEWTLKGSTDTCLDGTAVGETTEVTVGLNVATGSPKDGKLTIATSGVWKTTTEPVMKK